LQSSEGEHRGYRQRFKWWAEDQPESEQWITLDDTPGAPLPQGEYAVALVAHRTMADFGSVTITPLEPIIVD